VLISETVQKSQPCNLPLPVATVV